MGLDRAFYERMEENPLIAAVKDMEGLEECCGLEDISVVFILFGDICTVGDIVKRVKDSGKMAMVHLDLINGLNSKEITVDFIKKFTSADGIITTKPVLIKRAKELGMYTVLRYFILDSMALENILHQQKQVKPDFIEILPGIMPKITKEICMKSKTPIIAGGLVSTKEAVLSALSAGAVAVSTTNRKVWRM